MEPTEEVTAEVKSLQLKGDIELNSENYQEALKYYRQAYDLRMVYYTRMDNGNSKLYKRLAKVLYYIKDNHCEKGIPNLTEAEMCAKKYIKIKELQGKSIKNCLFFDMILIDYYKETGEN